MFRNWIMGNPHLKSALLCKPAQGTSLMRIFLDYTGELFPNTRKFDLLSPQNCIHQNNLCPYINL